MKKEIVNTIKKSKDKLRYKVLFLNMLLNSENVLVFKDNAYKVKKNDLMTKFDLFKKFGLLLNRKVYKGDSI